MSAAPIPWPVEGDSYGTQWEEIDGRAIRFTDATGYNHEGVVIAIHGNVAVRCPGGLVLTQIERIWWVEGWDDRAAAGGEA